MSLFKTLLFIGCAIIIALHFSQSFPSVNFRESEYESVDWILRALVNERQVSTKGRTLPDQLSDC